MAKFKRNLITTALPYANGPVHIGHLAGVYVPADIYVRYLRQKGAHGAQSREYSAADQVFHPLGRAERAENAYKSG